MKGVLFILVLLALLFGSYLVYKNLSEQTSTQGEATRIHAIDKAKKAAETVEEMQEKVKRAAREATD